MAYVFYNPNPLNKHIGDCVIRAVAKATENASSEQERRAIKECIDKLNA